MHITIEANSIRIGIGISIGIGVGQWKHTITSVTYLGGNLRKLRLRVVIKTNVEQSRMLNTSVKLDGYSHLRF